MSTKPPVRRYFDELYHFNPNHDPINGRFTSGRFSYGSKRPKKPKDGSVYDEYVNNNGTLTDKAKVRLNVNGSGNNGNKGNSGNNNNNGNKDKQNSNNGKDKQNNNSGNNNNNNGDKNPSVRVDSKGRVVPEDRAKAASLIEKNISQDYVSRSKAYKDASSLTSQASDLLTSIRKNRLKAEAQSLDLSNMTDKELNDFINRKSLEARYRAAATSDSDVGHTAIENFLTYGGAILTMGATAATIAATIHAIRS